MCETRAIHVMYRCVCFQEVDISISTSAVRSVGAHGLRSETGGLLYRICVE